MPRWALLRPASRRHWPQGPSSYWLPTTHTADTTAMQSDTSMAHCWFSCPVISSPAPRESRGGDSCMVSLTVQTTKMVLVAVSGLRTWHGANTPKLPTSPRH